MFRLQRWTRKPLRFWVMGAIAALITILSGAIALADQPLFVAYPPDGHETTSSNIFLIGTAPANGDVTVNGQPIRRSPAGHFAPSFPLSLGDNLFTLRHQDQELILRVNRQSAVAPTPTGTAFAEGSLTPAVDIARLPGEPICFEAIAPGNATVSLSIGTQTIPLSPQSSHADLPLNSAVLTNQNEPVALNTAQRYQGCTIFNQVGDLGQPQFQLTLGGQTIRQAAPGRVTILAPTNPTIVAVVVPSGTARTGPSTDYSRLTPLPTGTRATVTGYEGEWWRLDYGAWIRNTDVQVLPHATLTQTLIRSITSRQVEGATEIVFPLQVPVPVTVQQGDRTFTLTLHNITAQTDTIFLNDDPLIERLDWQQPAPGKAQYTFNLKSNQQWGYSLRYEGTSLILSLRHPPVLSGRSLTGATILLDPGHGGPEDLGSRGPTGYPEKDVALAVSLLLRDELVQRGATVSMTRTTDIDLPLQDRVNQINQVKPAIALSLHYNALPDSGDAENTDGVGTFWYNTQAHSLAVFLHNYLVEQGDRPSYGVFWNNLALTRPTIAPCVLLELGFMINPNEFEWIVNPTAQRRLADTLADGIEQWLKG
ncbi:MAG: N-acetylmuramoyl-L-alanine amidase [Oculatellaceae cyanobacterium bins.114]|nr:N-acetylmuramoyl-L-alanine amidase [Oculatellaceae cyanobacterium bins.114]